MIDVHNIVNLLNAAVSLESLDEVYQSVLGKKGSLSAEFSRLKDLSPEEKKSVWQSLSEARTMIQSAFDAKSYELNVAVINEKLLDDVVDISLDPIADPKGYYWLLVSTRRHIEQLCKEMWFVVEYGHDVVSKYENFESVNIPLTHPATEMHDTIFLDKEDERGESLVLRTHTSAIQNGLMKKYGVPMRAVIPAKVYRYEDLDASHDTVFYQLEGMVIDKDVSIGQCKGFLIKLLSAIFEKEIWIRMRPAYFPFVEPGFEIDASCPICDGKGCSLCKKTWWIEILGAGMIHPNVLKEWGVDPSVYTWFAFGVGINRIVAIKYGISDIRYFTNWDLRFGQSF